MTNQEAVNILLNAYKHEVQKGGRGCGKTSIRTAMIMGANAIEFAEQYKYERDVAIEQLNELGISLGEKLDTRGEEFGICMTCQRCGKQTFRKKIGLDNFKPIPKGWKVNKDYYHNGWWCPDCVKEYTL